MTKPLLVIIALLLGGIAWQYGQAKAAHAQIARLVPALEQAEHAAKRNAEAARELANRLHQCIGEQRAMEQRALDAAARVAEADAARAQAQQDADAARAALAAADSQARDFFAHAIPASVADRWRAAL